jgi:hypothetical protein
LTQPAMVVDGRANQSSPAEFTNSKQDRTYENH